MVGRGGAGPTHRPRKRERDIRAYVLRIPVREREDFSINRTESVNRLKEGDRNTDMDNIGGQVHQTHPLHTATPGSSRSLVRLR